MPRTEAELLAAENNLSDDLSDLSDADTCIQFSGARVRSFFKCHNKAKKVAATEKELGDITGIYKRKNRKEIQNAEAELKAAENKSINSFSSGEVSLSALQLATRYQFALETEIDLWNEDLADADTPIQFTEARVLSFFKKCHKKAKKVAATEKKLGDVTGIYKQKSRKQIQS